MYKLLVVEDEVLIRDIIKEYFALRDYEVIEAVDGYDALNKVNQDIDMVLLDIKHITREGYIDITQVDRIDEFFNFVDQLNKTNVEVWIRQVIVPGVHDNDQYMHDLVHFIKKYIKNVTRVDFL